MTHVKIKINKKIREGSAMAQKLITFLCASNFIRGSSATVLSELHYSVLFDSRADEWSSDIQSFVSESGGIVKLRSPILNITISPDLSNPRDIDLLQALFFGPLPAQIIVRPFSNKSSMASVILGKCFDTIAFDSRGKLDSVRVRDFINSLFLLAELSVDAPLDGSAGKRISERAALLVCRLYTQQFPTISDWIDSLQRGEVLLDDDDSNFRSVVINDRLFPHTVPVSTVLQSLVEIQHETIRSISNVYDEL